MFDTSPRFDRMRALNEGRLAQLVEQCPYKAWVTSSSLVPPTKILTLLNKGDKQNCGVRENADR